MNAHSAVCRCPVETDTRCEVVLVAVTRAVEERQNERIQLVRAADVLYISIELVPEAQIERELRVNSPIILEETCKIVVVGIRNYQRAISRRVWERDGKQQVIIIDAPVAVVIEIREILNKLDSALLKNAEIEIRIDALDVRAKMIVVRSLHQ